MIAVVDYGVGNLFSLSRSLGFIGLDCVVTSDRDTIDGADSVILPGVGAFGDAADKLASSGLGDAVIKQAQKGKPLLGICLGMQLLFEESLEFGRHKGLGLLPGVIEPLHGKTDGLKVPHMGWNNLRVLRESPLLTVNEKPYVYFIHSYFAGISDNTIASALYGGAEISAVVGRGNVYGTQFHPEKSGKAGLEMLKAFGGKAR